MSFPIWLDTETKALTTYELKLQHVRAGVQGVVQGFHTGLFLWGEPGTGKSRTVITALEKLEADYVLHNSRLTARGLIDALKKKRDHVHLIEDAETMFDDKKTAGVLRSALSSQSDARPCERTITWSAYNATIRFTFRGGIIITSNVNLADHPEIQATKTRLCIMNLDPSKMELWALQKKICQDGFNLGELRMDREECWDVAGFLHKERKHLTTHLDTRLLVNGFKDYLQCRSGASCGVSWQDLLLTRMREEPFIKPKPPVMATS